MTDQDTAYAAGPVEVTVVGHKGATLMRPKAPAKLTVEVFALAANIPTRILGANPHRCKAVVTALAAAFLGADQAVTVANGYPIPLTTTIGLQLTTTESVWAVCSVATTVFVLAEHYDG